MSRPSILSRCLVPLVSSLPRLDPRNVAEALDLLIPVAKQLVPHGLLDELVRKMGAHQGIGAELKDKCR